MENIFQQEEKIAPTRKFEFDINAISLEDLRTFYKHFKIEDFKNADEANCRQAFFNCFAEDGADGNKEAFLLIRLASIIANDGARILECDFVNCRGKQSTSKDFVLNANIELDFEAFDYYDFNPDGFHIMFPIYDYSIEDIVPLLKKYNFLRPI